MDVCWVESVVWFPGWPFSGLLWSPPALPQPSRFYCGHDTLSRFVCPPIFYIHWYHIPVLFSSPQLPCAASQLSQCWEHLVPLCSICVLKVLDVPSILCLWDSNNCLLRLGARSLDTVCLLWTDVFCTLPWSLLDDQKQSPLCFTIPTCHYLSSTDKNWRS